MPIELEVGGKRGHRGLLFSRGALPCCLVVLVVVLHHPHGRGREELLIVSAVLICGGAVLEKLIADLPLPVGVCPRALGEIGLEFLMALGVAYG